MARLIPAGRNLEPGLRPMPDCRRLCSPRLLCGWEHVCAVPGITKARSVTKVAPRRLSRPSGAPLVNRDPMARPQRGS